MDIRSYIKDLLYLHDCVIIPGFGGFVTGEQSAEIHKYRNLIYPPAKTILFNRKLQTNDGVFINYLSQKENLDYRSAEDTIKQFAIWWNRQLESRSVVNFPDVGKLYINSGNMLVFLPELRKNYLPESFGLKPIAFHPQMEIISIHKNKEQTDEPLDEAELAERLRLRRRRRTRLVAVAALIGALLLVPQLFMQSLLPEKARIEQLNVFDFFSASKAQEEIKPENASVVEVQTDKTENKTAVKDTSHPAASITASKPEIEALEPEKIENYYIILGSYDLISDAIRHKKIFESNFNQTVEVFPSEDGSYFTGVSARGTKTDAESSLLAFTTDEVKPQLFIRRN